MHVRKLLEYVESVADEKPRMYEKSKYRLRDLASTCNKVVSVISEILQEEVLMDDIDEFEDAAPDVDELLASMEEQLGKLREFTATGTKATTVTVTPSSRKKAIAAYRNAFKSMISVSSGYEYADECASMLWNWLDLRFYKTTARSTFRYNMKRFPTWVRDFVILYGYSVHTHSSDKFMFEFHKWLELIQETDAKDKYAVPYNVYQFGKYVDESKLTLESAVIWDILLDKGLRQLCIQDDDGLYLEEDAIYELLGNLKPEELDNYSDYKQDDSVIDYLGWR